MSTGFPFAILEFLMNHCVLFLFTDMWEKVDEIALLKHKLFLIHKGLAFNRQTNQNGSQGKKFQVSVEQEAIRLLGNLGWALMQRDN